MQLRRLLGERLLILKGGHCLRAESLAVCERARARFGAQFEADQLAGIFELIRAGFGVSIVPEMARRSADGCKLLAIEPAASRRIGYVRLERRYISKPIEAFRAYLREIVRARAASGGSGLLNRPGTPKTNAALARGVVRDASFLSYAGLETGVGARSRLEMTRSMIP